MYLFEWFCDTKPDQHLEDVPVAFSMNNLLCPMSMDRMDRHIVDHIHYCIASIRLRSLLNKNYQKEL